MGLAPCQENFHATFGFKPITGRRLALRPDVGVLWALSQAQGRLRPLRPLASFGEPWAQGPPKCSQDQPDRASLMGAHRTDVHGCPRAGPSRRDDLHRPFAHSASWAVTNDRPHRPAPNKRLPARRWALGEERLGRARVRARSPPRPITAEITTCGVSGPPALGQGLLLRSAGLRRGWAALRPMPRHLTFRTFTDALLEPIPMSSRPRADWVHTGYYAVTLTRTPVPEQRITSTRIVGRAACPRATTDELDLRLSSAESIYLRRWAVRAFGGTTISSVHASAGAPNKRVIASWKGQYRRGVTLGLGVGDRPRVIRAVTCAD